MSAHFNGVDPLESRIDPFVSRQSATARHLIALSHLPLQKPWLPLKGSGRFLTAGVSFVNAFMIVTSQLRQNIETDCF